MTSTHIIPPPPEPTPIWLHGKPSRVVQAFTIFLFAFYFVICFGFLVIAMWAAIDPPPCGAKRDLFTECVGGLQ